MPRRNERLVLKLRYRREGKHFGTKLILSNGSKPSGKDEKGRLMGCRKVSYEELFKVGEFSSTHFSPEFQEEFKGRLS
jgi:hypothetical protein